MSKKIADLASPAALDGTELLEMSQGGISVKATLAAIYDFITWKTSSIIATTSGTIITLTTAIPSDALEIEVIFNGVSTDTSAQPPIVRLGDAGGVETTGYTGVVRGPTGESAVTNGFYTFRTNAWAAADVLSGRMRLTRWYPDQHTWMADGLCNDLNNLSTFSGKKTTSEVLTTIVLTTPGGTAIFDAGSARVRWR